LAAIGGHRNWPRLPLCTLVVLSLHWRGDPKLSIQLLPFCFSFTESTSLQEHSRWRIH
jgi:hypothetical protein